MPTAFETVNYVRVSDAYYPDREAALTHVIPNGDHVLQPDGGKPYVLNNEDAMRRLTIISSTPRDAKKGKQRCQP